MGTQKIHVIEHPCFMVGASLRATSITWDTQGTIEVSHLLLSELSFE